MKRSSRKCHEILSYPRHLGSWSGPVWRKRQEGKDPMMKNDDFGRISGAHFLLRLLVFCGWHFFCMAQKTRRRGTWPSWRCLKDKKAKNSIDLGWRKRQEGKEFQAKFPEVEWSKTQEGRRRQEPATAPAGRSQGNTRTLSG